MVVFLSISRQNHKTKHAQTEEEGTGVKLEEKKKHCVTPNAPGARGLLVVVLPHATSTVTLSIMPKSGSK